MAASHSQVEAMGKAYAGVMLNMAQESAARVLAAERRAVVLAAGLEAVKEDGVAALVRLKAIMKARIKEVELQSMQYIKRIKELEERLQCLQHIEMKELAEQLYDAQNSVSTLQFELQVANTELEKTRKTLAEERIKQVPTSKMMDSNRNTSSRLKMNLQSGSMSFKNKKTADETCVVPAITEDNGAMQNMQNVYPHSPSLTAFMERNKKPKLYHSRSTQRIHALKQQNQGQDACQERNHKRATGLNSRSKVRKNDASKNPCRTRSIMEQLLQMKFLGKCKGKRGRRGKPCYNHDSSSKIREAEYKLPDTSDRNGCLLLLQALEQDLSPLKPSAGHREGSTDLKDDSLMNRGDASLNLCTASPELIDILAAKNVLVQKRKRSKTVRVLEADFSDSKSVPEPGEKSMSDTELISEMKDNDSDTPPEPEVNGPFLQHTTKNLMRQDDAVNGQLESGNSSTVLLQSCKNEVMDYGNLPVEKPEHKTLDNSTASLKEANGEGSCNLASHKVDASSVISLDQENEEKFKASSGLPMQASEKPNASAGSSLYKEKHAKASAGPSMQVDGARQIKYTFNRRKRMSVSTDSTPLCAVQGKSNDLLSAHKEGETHPNAEPRNNLIGSQGDNQLVQVAQQLIFLSESNL